LIAEQRYVELIIIAAPEEVYGNQLAMLELIEGTPTAALTREGLRSNLVKTGMTGVEALACAVGTSVRAENLSCEGKRPLRVTTRQQLIERARLAGDSALAEALIEKP
jgi:hypothetical protein